MDRVFDLAIIGGGINGCGIARDAAGRGNSVFLCEMNDLASGTSSWSTKLVHGGLRYLDYCVSFCRTTPALRPGLAACGLGLFLYDHIGGRDLLPPTRSVDLVHDEVGKTLDRQPLPQGL